VMYCMLELQDQKVIYGLSALLKHSFTIISNLINVHDGWPGRLDILIFTTVIFGNIYYVV